MPSDVRKFRLSNDENIALETYANKTGQTISEVIREALHQLIPDYPAPTMRQGKRTDLDQHSDS